MTSPAALAHDVITTNLTWTQEISRIVNKHCVSCHREGGTSMPLTTYEETRPWAKAIRDEDAGRRMPPWDAVKGVGDFRDDQSLSTRRSTCWCGWVEGGAPEGDTIYLPPAPRPRLRAAALTSRGKSWTCARPRLPAAITLAGIRRGDAGRLHEVIARLPDGTVEHALDSPYPRNGSGLLFPRAVELPRAR